MRAFDQDVIALQRLLLQSGHQSLGVGIRSECLTDIREVLATQQHLVETGGLHLLNYLLMQGITGLSQLTHIIAVTLMDARDMTGLEKYTGDSFRDLTRIARINDEMWSELFLDNKTALLKQMEIFKVGFDKMYTAVKNGDREGLREMMRTSTERRGWFDR